MVVVVMVAIVLMKCATSSFNVLMGKQQVAQTSVFLVMACVLVMFRLLMFRVAVLLGMACVMAMFRLLMFIQAVFLEVPHWGRKVLQVLLCALVGMLLNSTVVVLPIAQLALGFNMMVKLMVTVFVVVIMTRLTVEVRYPRTLAMGHTGGRLQRVAGWLSSFPTAEWLAVRAIFWCVGRRRWPSLVRGAGGASGRASGRTAATHASLRSAGSAGLLRTTTLPWSGRSSRG